MSSSVQEQLSVISNNWGARGEPVVLIAMFIIASLLSFATDQYLLSRMFDDSVWASVTSLVAFNLAAFLIWQTWRHIPHFLNDEIGILFAPFSDSDCADLVLSMHSQLERELKQGQPIKNIRCHLIPYKIELNDHEKVTKILSNSGARVIVYGVLQKASVQGRQVEGFHKITFGMRHRALAEAEVEAVHDSISQAIHDLMFTFESDNSFIERSIVISNISEMSRYFIGLALALDGDIERSIPILRELLGEIDKKSKASSFRQPVADALVHALEQKSAAIYESMVDNITQPEANAQALAVQETITEIQQYSADKKKYDLTLAVIAFHFGDTRQAKRLLFSLRKMFKKRRDASVLLSLGFIYLWEGNYSMALGKYRHILTNGDVLGIGSFLNVIRFIDGLIQHHPEKPELLFASAFLNEQFFDAKTATREYEIFIASTVSAEMIDLHRYAEARIKNLNSANK
jgi:tetratricopeptide (TPR) repeat protein